jgi:pimeloyl-ACP methyl ester carboxylesterase
MGLHLPWMRRQRVDWLRDEYTRYSNQLGFTRPSIIAHSFGTYVVARSLEVYGIQFDRIVFCGSIVRRDYPWSKVLDRDLARHVLNDYGRIDVWAWIAEWVARDAGQSGLRGFEDHADGRIIQREPRVPRPASGKLSCQDAWQCPRISFSIDRAFSSTSASDIFEN